MPRLLYLCVHPRNRSPSQRYRFEQFESHIRAAGFEIDYASALTPSEVPVFYGDSSIAQKGAIALRALGRRAWSVTPHLLRPKYDVVFVQREAFFLFDAWSEWLAHLQAPLVFDFDDAIWIHAISEANRRFSAFKNVDKIRRIVGMSHTILAGNEYLARWARQYAHNVMVFPTCVDTERYTPPPFREHGPVTIGWCGSPSTVAHLRILLPVLERIAKAYPNRVRIRVMGDPNFRFDPIGLVGETWSSDGEISFLRDMDVGIMPLPEDEWSKGKCGLKGLTSMACGAATVLSPVGVNPSIVQHGVNGLLAGTPDEWFECLSRLIEDRDLRRRLSVEGRRTIVERYSVSVWRDPLVRVLLAAAEAPGGLWRT